MKGVGEMGNQLETKEQLATELQDKTLILELLKELKEDDTRLYQQHTRRVEQLQKLLNG